MNDKTVTIDSRAMEALEAMHRRVQAIGSNFGENSREYRKASVSLNRALMVILTSGFSPEAKVFRDGDLSLYVNEGGYAYGVIFFRDRSYDDDPAMRSCQPGEWSVHS